MKSPGAQRPGLIQNLQISFSFFCTNNSSSCQNHSHHHDNEHFVRTGIRQFLCCLVCDDHINNSISFCTSNGKLSCRISCVSFLIYEEIECSINRNRFNSYFIYNVASICVYWNAISLWCFCFFQIIIFFRN